MDMTLSVTGRAPPKVACSINGLEIATSKPGHDEVDVGLLSSRVMIAMTLPPPGTRVTCVLTGAGDWRASFTTANGPFNLESMTMVIKMLLGHLSGPRT